MQVFNILNHRNICNNLIVKKTWVYEKKEEPSGEEKSSSCDFLAGLAIRLEKRDK